MTKKGFTLVELLATIVIIAFIMGIVLPSATRVSKDNKYEMCNAYKKMMVEYVETNPKSNTFYVNLSDLDELNKIKEDCEDGYVTIDYAENGAPIYEAHLDCPKVCPEDDDFIPASDERREMGNTPPTCKQGLIYNGQYQELVNRNDRVYSLINEKRLNVGKQNVTATLKDKNQFAWSDRTQDTLVVRDCEIHKRDVTLVAIDKEFTYVNDPHFSSSPEFTYKVENTVKINGVEENPLAKKVTYRIVDSSGDDLADRFLVRNSGGDIIKVSGLTPAGTYRIIPSSSVTNNYNLKIQEGKLVVHKRPITITAASSEKTYDGVELTNSNCTMSEAINNFTVTCTMDNNSKITNVGSVNNTISVPLIKNENEDVTVNFAITKKTGTLKINRRTLNVIADDKSKWHTQENPALTVTYNNQVSGEIPGFTGALTTTAVKKSDIGDYDITQGTLALTNNGNFLASNYVISFTKGNLKIKNPCATGIERTTRCGDWSSCSATCIGETAQIERSCTQYSTKVSGYACYTYSDPGTCNGTVDCSPPSGGGGGGGSDCEAGSGRTFCSSGYYGEACAGGTCGAACYLDGETRIPYASCSGGYAYSYSCNCPNAH